MKKHTVTLLIILFISIFCKHDLVYSQAPKIELDQELIRYALLTGPKQIRYFVEDFMIPEASIDKLKVYDLLGDGFGAGDFARTFPGGKVYMISPGKKAQAIMNEWTFGDNLKFTAHTSDSPETFESISEPARPLGGIFAGLLRGLRRNYKGMPFKIYMEQVRGVAAVEMWGYDKSLLKYVPPPERNKEVVKPVYNLIYLEKTISDTIYTAPKPVLRTSR